MKKKHLAKRFLAALRPQDARQWRSLVLCILFVGFLNQASIPSWLFLTLITLFVFNGMFSFDEGMEQGVTISQKAFTEAFDIVIDEMKKIRGVGPGKKAD